MFNFIEQAFRTLSVKVISWMLRLFQEKKRFNALFHSIIRALMYMESMIYVIHLTRREKGICNGRKSLIGLALEDQISVFRIMVLLDHMTMRCLITVFYKRRCKLQHSVMEKSLSIDEILRRNDHRYTCQKDYA